MFNEAITLSTAKVMKKIYVNEIKTVLAEIKKNMHLQVCMVNVHVQMLNNQ